MRPGGRRRGSAIHDGLVGARELVGKPYLADPALREEYAHDIAPRTELALARVLDHGWTGLPAPVRALDLGAGTGAVGRALRARFGDGLELVAVDRTGGPGVVRANLAVELPPVEGRFELVVAAHLLNELFVERAAADRAALRAARVLAWARAFLAPAGRLVVIEPALRETSRELLAVRDRLLPAGLHVVAPCFFAGPCPALASERDWCHDAAAVPGQRARVDFSYLVLAAAPVEKPDHERVVSDRLPEKGRLRLYVCGAEGRRELIRLDRHRSPANAPLDTVSRGDALSMDRPEPTGNGLRVTPETTIVWTAPEA
ncbi:MAG TPA: small ribosomal subunit Rsm22 family protein [Polyangia bacterium]|nr:small ribosomal subunit Rsm22 family protein [Polyangia bacterium]